MSPVWVDLRKLRVVLGRYFEAGVTGDLYRMAAAELFDVDASAVTPEQRAAVKLAAWTLPPLPTEPRLPGSWCS